MKDSCDVFEDSNGQCVLEWHYGGEYFRIRTSYWYAATRVIPYIWWRVLLLKLGLIREGRPILEFPAEISEFGYDLTSG